MVLKWQLNILWPSVTPQICQTVLWTLRWVRCLQSRLKGAIVEESGVEWGRVALNKTHPVSNTRVWCDVCCDSEKYAEQEQIRYLRLLCPSKTNRTHFPLRLDKNNTWTWQNNTRMLWMCIFCVWGVTCWWRSLCVLAVVTCRHPRNAVNVQHVRRVPSTHVYVCVYLGVKWFLYLNVTTFVTKHFLLSSLWMPI